MRFLMTCGGTAGHINPAIAVCSSIKQLLPDSEFLFVGAEGMMETELVPRAGHRIETVRITNLQRSFKPKAVAHNLKTVYNVAASLARAKRIIKDFVPDAAIGTGGYVCYPVLTAAHSLGIPSFVHESNVVPGLTTKLLSKKVDCVLTGFEEARANFPGAKKVVFTGTPVREGFANADKAEMKRCLGFPSDKPLVLSVWGSLGSEHMNKIMTQFAPLAAENQDFSLVHSVGKRDYKKFLEALGGLSLEELLKRGVDIREYIYNMPDVMSAADIIMCRSGASTLAELGALGKPCILIPSPNVTANHQEKNARALEKVGAAVVMLEGEFTGESLYGSVRNLLAGSGKLESMSRAMKASAKDDAARCIAEIVLEHIG